MSALAALSDEQLLEAIVHSPESKALVSEGVKTRDELLLRLAKPVTATAPESRAESSTDELLR